MENIFKRNMNNISVKLGTNLNRARIEARLSIKQLSYLSKIGKDTISSIEAGRANPLFSTIYRLAKTLKTTPSSLCEGF